MSVESRPTLRSVLHRKSAVIMFAVAFLPTLVVLILSMSLTDGSVRLILLLPAVLTVALLLWELWGVAALRLEVDENGLRYRAAQRRVQLAWADIHSAAYVDDTAQIRLTTAEGKTTRLATAYLPQQDVRRIKQMIAERVPGESVTITLDKPATQLTTVFIFLMPASFIAGYLVAKLLVADGSESSVLSLWIGFYFFFIIVPLVPTLLLAGPYWMARRKVMRGAAWIMGIVWFLLVALMIISPLLPDAPSY